MNRQIITAPGGERMVVLSEAEYDRLVEAAEDAEDIAAVRRFERELSEGREELIPSAIVNRLLGGESRVAVWREHRGLSARELAARVGITQAYLSQIETGKREGTVATLKKIAAALNLALDDIV